MVYLMLYNPGQKPFRVYLYIFPFKSDGFHRYKLRPHYIARHTGYAETSLAEAGTAFLSYYYGIYQYQGRPIIIHILYDYYPLADTYLRRSQAHSLGTAHSLYHIICKGLLLLAYFLYRDAFLRNISSGYILIVNLAIFFHFNT